MTTDDIKLRFEYAARIGKYRVQEWLQPALNGEGLRVVATTMIKGVTYGYGFKWNGERVNDLANRCMALDYGMSKVPDLVEQGKGPLWAVHDEPQFGVWQ